MRRDDFHEGRGKLTDPKAIATRLQPRALRAIRFAIRRDGKLYVDTFAAVPSNLISHQVWGRGTELNALGEAVYEAVKEQADAATSAR